MKRELIYIIGAIVLALGIVKACEQEPKIKVETKTVYEKVYDTIREFEVIDKPVKVYIERTKTLKGKDSLIYVLKPSDNTLESKQYNTLLKSNNATARLKITANELFDVSGTIEYEKEITTTKITKVKAKSGLFIYADVPVSNMQNVEAGLIYQFKNSFLLKGGVQYNNLTKTPDLKVGIGIKIF